MLLQKSPYSKSVFSVKVIDLKSNPTGQAHETRWPSNKDQSTRTRLQDGSFIPLLHLHSMNKFGNDTSTGLQQLPSHEEFLNRSRRQGFPLNRSPQETSPDYQKKCSILNSQAVQPTSSESLQNPLKSLVPKRSLYLSDRNLLNEHAAKRTGENKKESDLIRSPSEVPKIQCSVHELHEDKNNLQNFNRVLRNPENIGTFQLETRSSFTDSLCSSQKSSQIVKRGLSPRLILSQPLFSDIDDIQSPLSNEYRHSTLWDSTIHSYITQNSRLLSESSSFDSLCNNNALSSQNRFQANVDLGCNSNLVQSNLLLFGSSSSGSLSDFETPQYRGLVGIDNEGRTPLNTETRTQRRLSWTTADENKEEPLNSVTEIVTQRLTGISVPTLQLSYLNQLNRRSDSDSESSDESSKSVTGQSEAANNEYPTNSELNIVNIEVAPNDEAIENGTRRRKLMRAETMPSSLLSNLDIDKTSTDIECLSKTLQPHLDHVGSSGQCHIKVEGGEDSNIIHQSISERCIESRDGKIENHFKQVNSTTLCGSFNNSEICIVEDIGLTCETDGNRLRRFDVKCDEEKSQTLIKQLEIFSCQLQLSNSKNDSTVGNENDSVDNELSTGRLCLATCDKSQCFEEKSAIRKEVNEELKESNQLLNRNEDLHPQTAMEQNNIKIEPLSISDNVQSLYNSSFQPHIELPINNSVFTSFHSSESTVPVLPGVSHQSNRSIHPPISSTSFALHQPKSAHNRCPNVFTLRQMGDNDSEPTTPTVSLSFLARVNQFIHSLVWG